MFFKNIKYLGQVLPIDTWSRIIFLGAVFNYLSGCATYVYKEEVLTFSKGVEQTGEMFASQREFLQKTGINTNREDLLAANSPRLVISEQCQEMIICLESMAFSSTIEKHCSKEILPELNTANKEPLNPDGYTTMLQLAAQTCTVLAINGQSVDVPMQIRNQSAVMDALLDYAQSLTGIVDANNRESLAESVSKMCGSAQKMYIVKAAATSEGESDATSGTTDENNVKKAKELKAHAVGSICGMILESGIGYFSRVQFNVLKNVVNKSDTTIALLADYLSRESRKIHTMILRHELENLNQSVENTIAMENDTKEYLMAVDVAVTQRNKFVTLLINHPEPVFRQLAMAHNHLKKAINDPKTQLTEAIGIVERFFGHANSAYDAIKDLQDL